MKRKQNVVVMYAKWPNLEDTKTRISEETSRAFARDLSQACLDDMVQNIAYNNKYDFIFGMNTQAELSQAKERYGREGILTPGQPTVDRQTLQSSRIAKVFSDLLQEYAKVVLIPMDIPTLKKEDIEHAFTALEESKYVVGPEHNGGVYLIGVKRPSEESAFQAVRWSSSNSCEDLIRNFGNEQTAVLTLKSDLNTMRDLLNQRESITATCPAIGKLLSREGYGQGASGRFIDYDELNISIPVALAVIERNGANGHEILIQYRHKPTTDSTNTGKLEVPSGVIERYEFAPLAAEREAEEETGLKVRARPSRLQIQSAGSVQTAIYQPFACVQTSNSGRAYLGIAFLCDVVTGVLRENKYETRRPQWITRQKLRSMLTSDASQFFHVARPVLSLYAAQEESSCQ